MSASCNCGGTCGCCEGIAIAVPQPTANRPGLPALLYRVGTHATFLETMIARLSSRDFPALAALTTRDPADPSIALLDSWSMVADVLTFYQERIANEGYLRTATERRSVLELARLIGYKLRPGVAATVYLAYTLDEDHSQTPALPTETLIPAGSRSQSVPGPGESPQFFETAEDLDAHSDWNNLGVRLTEPKAFTSGDRLLDYGTDITTCNSLYFAGMATNLQPGDTVMVILGSGADQQAVRSVKSIQTQPQQNRTEVILQPVSGILNVEFVIRNYLGDTTTLFPGSAIATQAGEILKRLKSEALSATSPSASLSKHVNHAISQLNPLHDLALKRNFTRLEPWLAEMMDSLAAVVSQTDSSSRLAAAANLPEAAAAKSGVKVSSLSKLTTPALLKSLTLPPSLQPRNSTSLKRAVSQTFDINSDMGPRMLATFLPTAAPILYSAWTNLESPRASAQAGAVRAKAGMFPGTYPGLPMSKIVDLNTSSFGADQRGYETFFISPPKIANAWQDIYSFPSDQTSAPPTPPLSTIALDTVNTKILIGSWVMIDRPGFTVSAEGNQIDTVNRVKSYHEVVNVATASMTTQDGGYTSKVTQLTLNPPWLNDIAANDLTKLSYLAGFLPKTIVYAQTEPLDLAEQPLDVELLGDTIELDGVYEGLESGRWIIVSGKRTDIDNVSGIWGSERVMISGVTQAFNVDKVTNPGALHTILKLPQALAYRYDRSTVIIYGNVVKATHGQTNNEILGSGDAGETFQHFALKQKPLTFVPASTPAGVTTTLGVYVNGVEWEEADTLAGLDPRSRNYVTQAADDDTVSVIFGNGTEGARLPTGTGNVMAIYRNGIGQPGNVDANQISLLRSRPLNVKGVINPLRASGGADRDSRDQARRNAPLAVLSLDRLVSVQDYADFALTFAGIGKASSARLSDGQRMLVHAAIAGAGDIPIDTTSDLYVNFVQALKVNGDPYEPLSVAIRALRLLVISAQVKILADYLWENVAVAVRTALLNTFNFDNRNLGQPVFQSEVISAIQAVEGVAYVNLQILDSIGESQVTSNLAQLASNLKLNPVVTSALAKANSKAVNVPIDSILRRELVYLSADLPDTLILNQETP